MLWVTPFLPNARTRLKTAQYSPSEFWQDLQRPVPFEFGDLAVRTPTNHGTGSGLRVFGRKKPHLVDDRRNIVTPLRRPQLAELLEAHVVHSDSQPV